MLLGTSLRDYARRTSRAVAFSLAGALLLLVGVAFLTIAAWLTLERVGDSLLAAQVIGCVYVAGGLIFFAIASLQKRRVYRRPPPVAGAPDPLLQMFEGFLMGMDAGRRSSRSRRR
ncbi:hypothetical protein P775_17415 [Puniceibacterium antarcticum]|uniref:Holin-X, holin superfamily III n=1 Tax=Puniceibacterium antarcticum TaxID=1206336 RepID=A0A2G8RBB1_9RHOB|nr:phage holin family protein [Puniceibacterium antarcticum]PIL18822.1 hypothetical protein P775_17415 [Puniceibacterium antarcticum]